MLVNRLEDHALGKVEMTATQVQAARVLLNKTLPDLQAVQHSGPNEGPIEVADASAKLLDMLNRRAAAGASG